MIDPLDGTVNYLYELDNFAVSIAAEDADGPLVGVVHNPMTEADLPRHPRGRRRRRRAAAAGARTRSRWTGR